MIEGKDTMQRSLSGFEKAFCLSEPNVPINFALVACFTGEPDEPALHQALHCLHKRYQMAALRLDHTSQGTPCFTTESVPDFPLRVIEHAQAGDWQQVAAQELGENFDLTKGPLIRLVLLRRGASGDTLPGADLVLTFHHGIADGTSAVYFLRDLLCLLNNTQASLPAMPQPPDLLSLIPETAKRSLAIKSQILGMKSALWLMRRLNGFGLHLTPADRMIEGRPPWQHFSLTSRCLTQAQTAHLAARCKEEQTSVHAAVCTAWERARLDLMSVSQRWKRTTSSPVNLRGMLNAENAFGLYMSNAIIRVDCHPDRGFWEIAREIKNRLNQDLKTGRVYHWVLTMNGIMDSDSIRQAVPTFATQPVSYDFSITNLGRLSLPDQGGSLVLDSVYGPIVNTSEQELTVGVSTACNRLTMTLTDRDFVLKPADAEKMMARSVDILSQASGW